MHRSAATPDARAKPGNLYREPGCPGPDAPPSRFPPTPQCVTAHMHTSQHTTHDSQYLTCSTCAHVQLTAHSTHTHTHDTQHTCTHCVPAKPFMLFCHRSCLPPGPDAVDTLWACRWLKETQYNKPSEVLYAGWPLPPFAPPQGLVSAGWCPWLCRPHSRDTEETLLGLKESPAIPERLCHWGDENRSHKTGLRATCCPRPPLLPLWSPCSGLAIHVKDLRPSFQGTCQLSEAACM